MTDDIEGVAYDIAATAPSDRAHGSKPPINWCIVCQRWIPEDEWHRDREGRAQEGHKDIHRPTVDLGNTTARIAKALGLTTAHVVAVSGQSDGTT